MGHFRGLAPLSSFLLLSSCFLPLIYAADKPRKSARAYSSPSSSSNSLYGSSSSGGSNGYNDNFDSAFDSMDLNNNGKSQKIRISLPNPPRPPRPPRPMKGPNMGSFENDPNRMPNMPRPPSPPAGFGPMDIEFNFPSYEPSVDDSFFDSDSGFGNSGYSSGFGSSSNNNGGSYSNGNNGNSNSNNGGGSSYGTRTQYGGTYYNSNTSSTTPRSSTLSSTQYATYSTAAGGGGAGGVGASTTVPPSSLQLCAPSTDPTITNGRCVQTAALASLCKSPAAAAPSTGCPAGELCCFNRANTPPPTTTANPPSTATATTTAVSSTTPRAVADGTICSPLTNPTVSNGRCTTTSVVSTQCVGQQLAKSNQCSTSQFCCFRAPQAAGALPSANRLTVEVSLPNESTASSTGSCRPASNPLAKGHCIGLQNLASACRGHQASKSPDCASQEWCCIDDEATGDRVSVGVVADIQPALTATADGSCRPKTNPSANGQCISSDLVAAQCASHQAAKSDDCDAQSWCCILGATSGGATSVGTTQVPPASSTQASIGGSCRPKTNPSANGQCLLAENIASQCASRQASKSDDCNAQSWCCILGTTSGGATSATTSQAPVTTQASTTQASNSGSTTQASGGTSGKTCRPATNPSASGQCFATASLSSQCRGRSASKSTDCSSDQWCCIIPSGSGGSGGSASVPAGTACTPRSNLAARGTCLATSGLSNDCKGRPAAKSDNCGSDQWCCFTAPAASTNKEASVEVKVTLNGNTDGNNVVVSPSISQATQCTPNDNPNVKNGKCLTMRELSQQCVDQKASASGDCAFGRFCCYSDNEVAGGGGGGNQAAVALSASAPSVSVQINKESGGDGGNNGPSVVISTASASSDSNSGNKEGSSSVVISTSSSSSSSAKTCSPNSNQAIKNGACMTIRELRISCVEHKASPSTDCDLGSWCCFSDDNAVVLPPPANTQVKIEVAAAPPVENAVAPAAGDTPQCVPNSKPDISNGVCLATKDLRTRCKNQRVSKSPQCKLGQWCCFNDSGAPVQLSLNEFSRNINTL